MKCVKCESENVCKNGFISKNQRYKCKNCSYNFTTGRPSKPLYLKRLALELYLEGLSFRSIGRILKVSNVSVLNWIKSFGTTQGRQSQTAEELRSEIEIDEMEIFEMEMDEMRTFIGSKKMSDGSGFFVDRARKKFINFIVGDRSIQTRQKLYNQINTRVISTIATDYWRDYENFR